MGNAVETSSQRIRNHLRAPIPGRGELLNENARNTVNEIVPLPFLAYSSVAVNTRRIPMETRLDDHPGSKARFRWWIPSYDLGRRYTMGHAVTPARHKSEVLGD